MSAAPKLTGPPIEVQIAVTVKLTRASADGPHADPDYLAEEVRQAVEEAAEQSVWSEDDVEYAASASAALAAGADQ